MAQQRLRLGETLVEAGILSQETLDKALKIQKNRQLRLGTILLQEGFVSESQLVQALSLKLSIPWVSLWRIDIPDELLDMVPSNVAEEFFLMPIYIRNVKEGGRALYVAMNDPTDEDALKFVSATAGIPVKPMIAGPTDIASAIRSYYYGEDDDDTPMPSAASQLFGGQPIVPSPSAPPAVPPPPPPPGAGAGQGADRPSSPSPPPPTPPPPPIIEELDEEMLEMEPADEPDAPTGEDDEAQVIDADADTKASETSDEAEDEAAETAKKDDAAETAKKDDADAKAEAEAEEAAKVFATKEEAQREAEKRMFGVGGTRATGGLSLTLMDGTTVSFGPHKKKKGAAVAAASGKLTREDFIKGLKAAAQGTPLDDFLPAEKWESYMAALLNVLFNKHLVFYEEFLKELANIEKKK